MDACTVQKTIVTLIAVLGLTGLFIGASVVASILQTQYGAATGLMAGLGLIIVGSMMLGLLMVWGFNCVHRHAQRKSAKRNLMATFRLQNDPARIA